MAKDSEKKTVSLNNFEKDLEQLEQIISTLEEGELSLEESIARFEQGMKLLKGCQKALENAERKVSLLVKEDYGFQLESLEENRKK